MANRPYRQFNNGTIPENNLKFLEISAQPVQQQIYSSATHQMPYNDYYHHNSQVNENSKFPPNFGRFSERLRTFKNTHTHKFASFYSSRLCMPIKEKLFLRGSSHAQLLTRTLLFSHTNWPSFTQASRAGAWKIRQQQAHFYLRSRSALATLSLSHPFSDIYTPRSMAMYGNNGGAINNDNTGYSNRRFFNPNAPVFEPRGRGVSISCFSQIPLFDLSLCNNNKAKHNKLLLHPHWQTILILIQHTCRYLFA